MDDDILRICEYYFLIRCGSCFELCYWDEESFLNGRFRSEEPPLRASSWESELRVDPDQKNDFSDMYISKSFLKSVRSKCVVLPSL